MSPASNQPDYLSLVSKRTNLFAAFVGRCGRRRCNASNLDQSGAGLLFENMLAIESGHPFVFGLLLQFFVTRANLFFAGGLRDSRVVEIGLPFAVDIFEYAGPASDRRFSGRLSCCRRRSHDARAPRTT